MSDVNTHHFPHEGILVVDDNKSDLKFLSSILREAGYTVRPASDGELALRSVQARLPALILLDIEMPDLDGYEVCRRLKDAKDTRDIPVIFISVKTSPLDKVKAFDVGGADYISKPFEPEEVLARVATHLAQWKAQKEIEEKNLQLQQKIAERVWAEEALRLHVAMMDNVSEGIYLIGLDDLLIKWTNEKFARMFGYDPEEMVGKQVDIVNAPTERPPADTRTSIVDVLKETGEWHGEVRNIKRDGTHFWCSANVSLFDHPKYGKVIVSVPYRHHRAQAGGGGAAGVRDAYRATFETTGTAMLIGEEDTTISMINTEFEKLCGYSKEEIEGKKSWVEFIVKADLERMKGYHNLRMTDPNVAPPYYEFQFIDKQGNVKDAFITLALIPGTKKTVGSLLDITERKRVEKELQESEQNFRDLVENLLDGIAIADENAYHIYVNPRFAEITGYSVDELLNMTGWDFTRPEDVEKFKQRMKERMAGEPHKRKYERVIIRKDGTEVLTEMSTTTTVWQGKKRPMVIIRDITARKQAEEELVRLSIAVRMSTDSIVIGDIEGKIVEVNEATLEMYGTGDKGDLIGKSSFDLIAPEERARAFASMQDALKKGYVKSQEYHIITKDGGRVLVEMSSAILKDADGKLMGFVGISRDITQRKRAEEALERRATQLALLNDAGAKIAAVLELDILLDGTAHLVQEGFGYHHVALFTVDRERGELVMKARAGDFAHLFPLDHRLKLGQGMVGWAGRHGETLLANDVDAEPRYVNLYPDVIPTRSELSVPIRVGGEVVGVLDAQSPLLNAFNESDVMVLETLADQLAVAIENARLVGGLETLVAARTAEIVAEKEKSEAILRSVGDAISVIDLQMRIQYVNEAFMALTGYTAQEAIGQPANFLVAERMSEHDWQSLQIALAEGEVWQGEAILRRKDGRTYDAALIITPVRDAEGHLVSYVSTHRNISRLKDLERARNRFITNVSHELRTPTANIKLYANLLRMAGRPERTGHYARVSEEQADRLTELIQDILEMTALDSGQGATVWKPVSLPTIITDAVTRYQSQAQASGLTLVAEPVPPDLPTVKGDQARLSQALGELVENAVIFTPAGGQVTVEARAVEEDWVTVAVRDTGPGISPEEQEQVFDRFYRGSLAESGHVPGTGLGLSIAQEIMRAHGGRVTVESKLGKGSTFTLRLRGAPS